MVDCFALLLSGDILNGAVCPFINIPYFGGFFYMLLILALEMAIYIKTEDIMMPSILGVLLAASSFALPDVFMPSMFYSGMTILLALNIGIIIYNVYKYSRG